MKRKRSARRGKQGGGKIDEEPEAVDEGNVSLAAARAACDTVHAFALQNGKTLGLDRECTMLSTFQRKLRATTPEDLENQDGRNDVVGLNTDLWTQILELTDLESVARFACVCRASREVARAVTSGVEGYLTFRRVNMNHNEFRTVLKLKSDAAERLKRQTSDSHGDRQPQQPLDNDSLREAVRMWGHKLIRAEEKHGDISTWGKLSMDSLREAVSMWSHDREQVEAKHGHIST